jgi:Rps23 Pro-64 3,4-dihydroxylase Tpa1-like proline 4-hydroxylase
MSDLFNIATDMNLPDMANFYGGDIYRDAKPYPHTIIDQFFPEDVLKGVLKEFPEPKDWPEKWGRRDDIYQKKFGSRGSDLFGPQTKNLIDQLNSQPFLDFLGEVTGIKGLMSDPELVGAGLHQIARDGYLAIHADFNKAHHRDRRLNLLVYLNEEWEEGWGGHFEMWNADLTKKERAILPIFNRVVIFNTDETSYHGHPTPLRCPQERARKSIALYYYTRGVRDDKVSDNFRTNYVDTNWKVPEKKKYKFM